MNQEGNAQRQHDEQFKAAQDGRDPSRKLDAAMSEQPDQGSRGQRQKPPRDMQAELLLQHIRDEIAEKAGTSGGAKNLIDQIAPRGHEAAAAPESEGGEGIIAAARRHVARELSDGVPYKKADDCREQEGERHRRTGFESNDGKGEDYVGRGRDVGNA